MYLVRARLRLTAAGAALCAGFLLTVILLRVDAVIAAVPVAYLCLWLAHRLPFYRVGRRNDISYGMYIYAFPVQQALAVLDVQRHGLPVFIAAGLVCTVPFAAVSWWFVERPAHRLRGLGRSADVLARRALHRAQPHRGPGMVTAD